MKTGEETTGTVVRFLIGILCAGALLLIVLIASGSEIDETSGRTIATAVALAFFSLTGVAGTNLAQRRPGLAAFGYFTAVISFVAFVAMTWSVWLNHLDDGSWRPAVYALILAFASGHASVLLAAAHDGDAENVRLVRGGTLLALATLVVLGFVEIASPGPDVGEQSIAVVAILYVLGTIVLGLLRRASAPDEAAIPPTPGTPGSSADTLPLDHVCLAWNGTVADALAHLHRRGVEVVEGPVPRLGAHGPGQSVYFRDADGGLVELIAYR
jgi:hypothetical protein